MRWIGSFGCITTVLALTLVSGCSKGSGPRGEQASESPPQAPAEEPRSASTSPNLPSPTATLPLAPLPASGSPSLTPDPSRQEKYDAALLDALSLIGERKYAEALAALEAARAVQDTEQVRREIAKLKSQQEQQAAAERTIQDIHIVLRDDKAEEAARLATAALQQYGHTDAAEPLARLKRQADALAAGQLADNAARRDRFRREGETALADKNLRAAAIAFEQTLQYGDNADLRRQLEEIRANLARYDDNRRRAGELRRDPGNLEDALAALQEAAQAWDTLPVRQEIDACNLALQKRRERLGVVDFEVRGDVGIPLAGRTLAEELLPAFRSRFDVIERGQFGKVIDELKLQASELVDNAESRREAGRLARLRYLVLGSVTRLSGITVNARLVDVRSGLVVQTARIVAATPEELIPLLPQLANVLLMTDEQKIAYEQRLAQQAPVEVQPVALAPPPPPPELPVAAQPVPPPLVVHSPRPPDLGGIRPEDFDRLPPPPPPGQPMPSAVVVVERAEPIKQKLVQVAVLLGDNLFLRGRFREAHTQFELALSLSPDRHDVRVRLDRCHPHLPPPPVVVVATPPPRPRIAIFNFVVQGDPAVLPPGLGAWVAEDIAPYFCPPYEVIDRGEAFWYMGRLGMTLRDLLTDPAARRYLARALNVRFLVFGTVRQGGGIEATTHLVDAEYGFELGAGRIRVANPQELKLRLPELAQLTLLDPRERVRFLREAENCQTLVVEARQRTEKGEFSIALDFYQKALKLRPDNIEVQVLFQRTERRARDAGLEEARRREQERQQALAAELQRRQGELAREAEAARIRAEQEMATRAETLRSLQEQRRERAHEQLLIQGHLALQQNNFQLSIQLFESAVGLKRNDATFRELALARARAEETARARTAEEQARREAELRRQREAELAQARAQLEEERRRREAQERARREAQEARDQAEYTRLLDEGQRLLAQEKYDAAINTLQSARRLRKTDEVERLVSQALVEQARATVKAQDARARAELERRLAEEKTRREQAEEEARRNRALYTQALQAAQQALAAKRYDQAVAKYQEAGKVFRTDAVLNGLREAEEAQKGELARAEADKRKQAEEQKRAAELQRLLGEGQSALQARQFEVAIGAFTAAKKLAPTNVDALAGLRRAELAREEILLEARRKSEDQQRLANLQKLLEGGKANLAAKQYDAAVLALREAVKLNPGDLAAGAALKEAEEARKAAAGAARNEAEAKKKAEEYQNRLREGQVALAAQQYEVAIKAFREAQRLLPGDQSSLAFLKDAEKAKTAAAALAAQAKKRQEEQQRTADVQKALAQGRTALVSRDLDAATKAFATAAQLAPNDPAVQQAQQDLRKMQDTVRSEAEARQKRLQEENQRAERVRQLVASGRAALGGRQLEAAAKAFSEASRLAPQDPAVKQAFQDLEQARKTAAADVADKKRLADYQEALRLGRAALAAKRFDEAAKAFADAGRLSPGDPAATNLLRETDKARSEAKATLEAETRKKEAEQNRRAAFTRLLGQGQTALASKRYEEAVKAYSEALKQQPGDPAATKALAEATRALEAAKAPPPPQPPAPQTPPPAKQAETPRPLVAQPKPETPPKTAPQPPPAGQAPSPIPPQPKQGKQPPPPPNAQAEYAKQMQAAALFEKQQKYAEAIRAYKEALRLVPKDAKATAALRKAEFTQRMEEGRKALAAKRFADAVREFEEALKLFPDHPEATKALKQAREGRP